MKKKIYLQQYVGWILFIIIGVLCGIMSESYVSLMEEASVSKIVTVFFEFLVFIYMILSFFIHIIIHEGGHCIFGLLTGYKFLSFRVFNLMWLKENGRIKFKRFSLIGTSGQCLMSPPNFNDGNFPYMLYNFGGSIVNFVFTIIALVLGIIFKNMLFFSSFLFVFSAIGVALAIMNGIPMRGMVDNDGYNAITLKKSKSELWSFWVQMKIAELNSNNVRLKNMPEEWFLMPNLEEMKNNMSSSRAVFRCNRFVDEHKFEEAQKQIIELLNGENAIISTHKHLLICDLIYCKIIKGESKTEIDNLLNKNQIQFMKSMKTNPSILRTEYAYKLLLENDLEKAKNIINYFNKTVASYPYLCEIESERELIMIADNYYEKIGDTYDKRSN